MPISPRAALARIDLPAHGSPDFGELAALGLKPEEVVDFSANLNPWGAPLSVRSAIAKVPISRYPDGEAIALRVALAGRLGVYPDQILAANGSSELIWLIAYAFLDPGDRVLIVGPTFGEYERAARLAGAEVLTCMARKNDSFRLRVREIGQTIERWQPRVVFLCNPNNPTGEYLDRASVEHVVAAAQNGLVVVDEAYLGFVAAPWSALDLVSTGALLMRSLTKDFGLAGLRLGYAVAGQAHIAALRKVRPPWNVNAVALAAGLACLHDGEHVPLARRRLSEAKDYLTEGLRQRGFKVLPSETSFFLVEVGNARRFRTRLLRRGLLVRDCRSFGLPDFVRIAARSLPECERLLAAIDGIEGERAEGDEQGEQPP